MEGGGDKYIGGEERRGGCSGGQRKKMGREEEDTSNRKGMSIYTVVHDGKTLSPKNINKNWFSLVSKILSLLGYTSPVIFEMNLTCSVTPDYDS
uniref:Uncharacterized protein n=1 Tax=Medicago truncatula TaxID=3880 RepID=A2Q4A3_MEDTR|nr:hypothetical protein MtrDRAFT_AC157375g2v1 [Medicago truncatula]